MKSPNLLSLLLGLILGFGSVRAGYYDEDEEVTTLRSGSSQDYLYYQFETENAGGYLSLELTFGPRGVEKCKISYGVSMSNSEGISIRKCVYDPSGKILIVEFKRNPAGLIALKARLGVSKNGPLQQRVFDSTLSLSDKRSLAFQASEKGTYFLQNRPKCKLTFQNDVPGRPYEFTSSAKELAVTLAYGRDNDIFIKQIAQAHKGTLLTRTTDYKKSTDTYELHIPRPVNIAEVLEHYSSDDRILCVTYHDVKDLDDPTRFRPLRRDKAGRENETVQ